MSRKTKKLKSNKTILIVAEGTTEKIYFSQMKSVERILGITIIPRQAKHSSLEAVLDTAIKEAKESIYDSIWCVFDRDILLGPRNTPDLQAKLQQAKSLGILFADSFPAFEIWFLLHFVLPQQHYSGQKELIKELEKHIKGYTKNNDWLIKAKLYTGLRPFLPVAKENSLILAKRNGKNKSPDCSMCNVFKLFDEIEQLSPSFCLNNNQNPKK